MTLKSLINSHINSVFLNEDHHAEDVTQFASGSGPGISVTALVDRPDPQLRTANGRETRLNPTLNVNSSVTVTKQDRWEIDGVVYETVKVGPLDAGFRMIELTHLDQESQGESSPAVL